MTRILDTNLLVRYFVEDDVEKADAVEKLLRFSKTKLALPDVVIAEIIWVCKSFYKQTKGQIISKINSLLTIDKIDCNRKVLEQALVNFQDKNVGWVDSYVAALIQTGKYKGIYSFDKGLDSIPGIGRIEPK